MLVKSALRYVNSHTSCVSATPPVKLEVVSKPQISLKSKAQTDEKAQHTRYYVSILKRLATQLLGLRWGFDATSNKLLNDQPAIVTEVIS